MPTKSKSKATASNVTVIKINPNIAGSGMYYQVWGGTAGAVVASGSALQGPVVVTVSGYDQYNVIFGGGIFSTPKIVPITSDASVTLAITVSQG